MKRGSSLFELSGAVELHPAEVRIIKAIFEHLAEVDHLAKKHTAMAAGRAKRAASQEAPDSSL